ncbi:MAG: 3'-5' exonuclease [Rhodoferax sp.]|jgi:ribonuclease D|nr:3'-5' exonuclease domain-containing protein 2 [Rhodoferax sp.]
MPGPGGAQAPHPTPSREDIAVLEPFEQLPLSCIELVRDAAHAQRVIDALAQAPVLGFDTESRPTFVRDEASSGPHVVQLATRRNAYVFQLEDARCVALLAELLAADVVRKVGFGLGDDLRRILRKLGVQPRGVLDLNDLFWQRGYRRDIGVRAAVAVMFQRRFAKSRKATTSNWARADLTPAQLLYAANDAYAALRVFEALHARDAGAPG